MSILSDYITDPKLTYGKFYKFGSHHKGTYFELPEGPETYLADKGKDSLDLNWLSLEDITYNAEHFTADQQSRIAAISNPYLHRGMIGCKNVLNGILGSVAGAKNYAKICMCCTKSEFSHSSLQYVSCDNWRYCEKCASKRRQAYFKQYYYYFDNPDENVYHVTLTVADKVTYTTENYQNVVAVWDRLEHLLTCLHKNKVISGALIFEEMTVDQLYPTTVVNPHLHAIVTSPHLLDAVEGMADVKAHVKQVKSKEQFRALLNYLPKAIDLSEIYISSWTKETSRVVNQNLREVMSGYRELFSGRSHTRCIGRFHGRHSASIAISPEDYKRFRALDPDVKKEGKKKTTGQTRDKKIKCKEASAKKVKKIMYQEPIQPEQPKKSGIGKFLGLGALGALSGIGAYHYGRSGDNLFSGVANQVHDNVVNPIFQRAEPLAQKLFPSLNDGIKQRYESELDNRLTSGELSGYVNHAVQQSPSGLQGTIFENYKPDQLSEMAGKVSDSPFTTGGILAGLGIPAAAVAANKTGLGNFLRNKTPNLASSLSTATTKVAPKLLGAAGGLASAKDSAELSSWLSNKLNLSGGQAATAQALGTVGGMGAAYGGAIAGAKIPGPPIVKLIGAGLGGTVLPIVNQIRRTLNKGELMHQGRVGRDTALIDALKDAIATKSNYGNSNALDVWKTRAGDLTRLAQSTQDPAIRQQILSLQ